MLVYWLKAELRFQDTGVEILSKSIPFQLMGWGLLPMQFRFKKMSIAESL